MTFSAWRAGTISWYSAGESPSIKVGWPEATPHSATACGGINTFWEMLEIFSKVWEKSADVDSAEPNSKEILLRLRQHFVDTRFLSTQDFCRREIFVDKRILWTREFCRLENFVDPSNFCQRKYFCRCQFFVAASILSPPIFLSVFRLRMIIYY
jgi:hypothetical protein